MCSSSFLLHWGSVAWFGRKRVIHCHVQLYTDAFLRRKAVEKSSYEDKPFAAQTPPRKRGYVEDFTLKSVNAYRNKLPLRNFKNSRFVLSLKLCCEIAARQARGWGWFLSKSFLLTRFNFYAMSRCGLRKPYFCRASVDFFCYFTVNRTYLSARLAYAR